MIRRALFLTILLLAVTANPVWAHDGAPHDAPLWARWAFDPLVLVGLIGGGWAYYRGQKTLDKRGGRNSLTRWRKISFYAGLLTVALGLVSPLDALAEELFSAHMIQHTLLMMIAPPLLILGMPFPALLLGLPRQAQVATGRIWKAIPWMYPAWKQLMSPMAVWLIHTGVLWGWHAPPFYSASVENNFVHAVQHTSFIAAALMFWWVVLRTYGTQPERLGTGVMYLFITAMQSGLLGALITFSPQVWYPVYEGRAEVWGLSALADQQLAGTIMWVPAGMVFLAAALALLKGMLDNMPSEEGIAPQKELK